MVTVAVAPLQSCRRHGGALKLRRGATFGEVSIAPLQPQPPANSSLAGTGTALAINYLTIGVAPDMPCSTGRGGARNRADRESHTLTARQIANLSAAERHAGLIGLPFTRMITIHWEAAGVALAVMAKATGRFLDLLTRWLVRKRRRTSWIWVHENGDGKGGHCHLLVHVPADLVQELTGKVRRWLRIISGKPYRADVIHSKPIGGRLGLEAGNPDLHASNLGAALGYVLKGVESEVAAQLGLKRLEPGGRVIGKRCGTSQNIAAKARKAKRTKYGC